MLGLCVGAVFMTNKIWMRPGGFVWGRQWLTLCSIYFFCRTKMSFLMGKEKKVESIRKQKMKVWPGALVSAVLAWAQVRGFASAVTG